jgi:hypothetical protein
MQFLRRITANGRRPAWALKLDVAGFFLCHRQIPRSSSVLAERK